MDKNIKLFIGLGNPDKQYQKTRHNFGDIVLNEIVASISVKFKINNNKKVSYATYYHNGSIDKRVFLIKPLVPMNLSGIPIASFMRDHKINPEEIFVFYDDFSILLGKYKIKMSGSSAGHHGLESLINCLKTCNFARMKLGIGPIKNSINTSEFVLSHFYPCDKEKINYIKKTCVILFNMINIMGVSKAASTLANIKI
ncbi:MAG: aminoacyl-tRNA hydrolase [Endomicrobium sp.]|jgi:PTH1 family peptidyl-tRNA hydrolase|nr:aminoacyl-tRNA hydrolase [Endomicrobium sp.]